MNFERVALLLHVAEACLKFPQLKAIHDAAVQELTQIAAGDPEEVEEVEETGEEAKAVEPDPQPQDYPLTNPNNHRRV